tara:strand:- start:321 stop:554 length:234 start_codon:yes stop_codon:yes gene_type:complete
MSEQEEIEERLKAVIRDLTYRSDFQAIAIIEYLNRKGKYDPKLMEAVTDNMKKKLTDEKFQGALVQGAFDVFRVVKK